MRTRYLCPLIAILLVAPVLGQVDRGAIAGTVSDQSAALVSGATVAINHLETGQAIRLTTSETGDYIANGLLIGTYSVSAEKNGFQKVVQPRVTVDVNKVVRVDLSLPVGDV